MRPLAIDGRLPVGLFFLVVGVGLFAFAEDQARYMAGSARLVRWLPALMRPEPDRKTSMLMSRVVGVLFALVGVGMIVSALL